jgi:hypothetical protein
MASVKTKRSLLKEDDRFKNSTLEASDKIKRKTKTELNGSKCHQGSIKEMRSFVELIHR